ncbi:hypothetical protein [Micromonospora sp. NPDC050695]|uniref:hypothetical protein n=1 Tax=Micromonospora sp. NPDC050695 TaxID=3154938 RepID=UPI0033DE1C9E
MGTETVRDTEFGWGVAWFLWNGPITVAVLSLTIAALTLADQFSTGDAIDIAGLFGAVALTVPCYGSATWMASSGLIAAIWATGMRNRILARLLLAILPALFAVLSDGARWVAFFVCSGLGLTFCLRLPNTPALRGAPSNASAAG